MERKLAQKTLNIDGMTCANCALKIESTLGGLSGVEKASASYGSGTATVVYDPEIISLSKIIEEIEKLDYHVIDGQTPKSGNQESAVKEKPEGMADKKFVSQLIGIGLLLFAGYLIIQNTVGLNFIPEVSQNMGYGILFVVGLITSLHCVAMCGGINLSQCVSYRYGENETGKWAKLKPSLMYNAGRVLSYTVVGGVVGGLGSVVSFSGTAKGIVAILSGVFMVIMGLNMLDLFPWLRRFVPRMPKFVGSKIYRNQGKRGPFYVGLLNGLMPCGPLQAMQIYALGTGSILAGALSMFVFSLGTVPLMFGFGALSSFLSSKFTHKMMKASAVLVMLLGIVMLNRGFALSGIGFPGVSASAAGADNVARIENNVQTVSTTLQSGSYSPLVVQKGVPVKWTIKADADSLNGCNRTITIPQYNLTKTLEPGDNEIEFTPQETGNITYTCWMGMIRSNITVVDDLANINPQDVRQDSNPLSGALSAGGCCGNTPARFANGGVPTDSIGVAKISGKEQEVTVKVDDQGYTPAVVVLQKGIPARIKFDTARLNSCNYLVAFPEYGGQLDLNSDKETPLITPVQDFTFQCGMGMLHGYVKVVDDLSKADLDAIKAEVQNYVPASGGSGCCG
ncbi:urease accessory protein UreH domain-containing protein [Caproiciproducens faecalis]|uniref:Sulfite exporter TauE/SafE family protein n=1 Tax=Caproiciproducens faecalis TaxID=2820301 RepID=A0ABS7DJK0_9FIRM|nr:sulfite exporter TauE/SafE family protein [Caproiciproducens faecalis]MBW7571465.1 sulfite exporter TauE/SafE family protein [Caproiciproducens faecalis]